MSRKYKAALAGVRESQAHYEALCINAEPESIVEWEAQVALAAVGRLTMPAAMDTYASQIETCMYH